MQPESIRNLRVDIFPGKIIAGYTIKSLRLKNLIEIEKKAGNYSLPTFFRMNIREV